MVRLNVFVEIRDSKDTAHVTELIKELVDKSTNDPGCIDYEAFHSLENNNHLIIVETWKDRKALDHHQQTEHFKRLLPDLEKAATTTITIFDF